LQTQVSPVRIAIAQIAMHWEMNDNVAAMKHALKVARDGGAALCAFAELAITGFHRRIVDWAKPELSQPATSEICDAAASLGIAAVFGAPTYGTGCRFNSHLFVDATGALIGTVAKNGITAAEASFFTAGNDRPIYRLAGMACSAVICREVEDTTQMVQALRGTEVQVIFWPGQMRPDPDKPPQDPPEHVVQAQDLARQVGAYVVQTNWPNALNRPNESENTGRSACISPDGELLFRLPRQQSGVGVFALGERTYRWFPSPADRSR
jgi:predicted amidohydrolase